MKMRLLCLVLLAGLLASGALVAGTGPTIFPRTFGEVPSNTTLTREVMMNLENFRVGATAPTNVTQGTTPTVPLLHFDATNELVTFVTSCSPTYAGGDITVRLGVVFSAIESNGDTLDLTIDYIAMKHNSTGDGPLKASTQLTPSMTVTTANGLAVGDVYLFQFTLSAADATNPLSTDVCGVAIELHLTNTTGVGEFDLMAGCMQFEALY